MATSNWFLVVKGLKFLAFCSPNCPVVIHDSITLLMFISQTSLSLQTEYFGLLAKLIDLTWQINDFELK